MHPFLKIAMIVGIAATYYLLREGAKVIVDSFGIFGALAAVAGCYRVSVAMERR